MLVEQRCFQMKKSHSKGLGKHLSDEAVWLFPAGDGSQGLLDSSALIHRPWREQGAVTGSWGHPSALVQPAKDATAGCRVPLRPEQSRDQAPVPLPLAQPRPGG